MLFALIPIVVPVLWLGLMIVVAAACRSAARGDREQPSSGVAHGALRESRSTHGSGSAARVS